MNGTASVSINLDFVRPCDFTQDLSKSNTSDMMGNVLYLTSLFFASGRNVWLPMFGIAITNIYTYTCVRVLFKASSPTLPFLNNTKSYLDIVPKCGLGVFVSGDSSGDFVCVPCASGAYANTRDARICR